MGSSFLPWMENVGIDWCTSSIWSFKYWVWSNDKGQEGHFNKFSGFVKTFTWPCPWVTCSTKSWTLENIAEHTEHLYDSGTSKISCFNIVVYLETDEKTKPENLLVVHFM